MARRYELGLAKGYVSDWTVQDALREFTQNGIDQETVVAGNTFSIAYDKERAELRMKNRRSVLEKSTLLLGCTSKADDAQTIGKFGEGYKLAVLVLLRNGYDVCIENYGAREVWNFKFSKLKKYDKVESLVVDIDTKHVWQKVPDDDLTVVVTGISEEDMEAYNERRLNPYCDGINTSLGKILLDPDMSGKIYVNGLFVTKKDDYAYGYDLKPEYIVIGRDRNLLDSWDLSSVTKEMWLESGETDRILKMVDTEAADVQHLRYSWNTRKLPAGGYVSDTNDFRANQSRFADSLWENIKEKNGGEVIIARDNDDKTLLEKRFGKKAIVVSPLVYSTVTSCSEDYQDFQDRYEEEVDKAEEEELTTTGKIWKWAYEYDVEAYKVEELLNILDSDGILEDE